MGNPIIDTLLFACGYNQQESEKFYDSLGVFTTKEDYDFVSNWVKNNKEEAKQYLGMFVNRSMLEEINKQK